MSSSSTSSDDDDPRMDPLVMTMSRSRIDPESHVPDLRPTSSSSSMSSQANVKGHPPPPPMSRDFKLNQQRERIQALNRQKRTQGISSNRVTPHHHHDPNKGQGQPRMVGDTETPISILVTTKFPEDPGQLGVPPAEPVQDPDDLETIWIDTPGDGGASSRSKSKKEKKKGQKSSPPIRPPSAFLESNSNSCGSSSDSGGSDEEHGTVVVPLSSCLPGSWTQEEDEGQEKVSNEPLTSSQEVEPAGPYDPKFLDYILEEAKGRSHPPEEEESCNFDVKVRSESEVLPDLEGKVFSPRKQSSESSTSSSFPMKAPKLEARSYSLDGSQGQGQRSVGGHVRVKMEVGVKLESGDSSGSASRSRSRLRSSEDYARELEAARSLDQEKYFDDSDEEGQGRFQGVRTSSAVPKANWHSNTRTGHKAKRYGFDESKKHQELHKKRTQELRKIDKVPYGPPPSGGGGQSRNR